MAAATIGRCGGERSYARYDPSLLGPLQAHSQPSRAVSALGGFALRAKHVLQTSVLSSPVVQAPLSHCGM